LSWDASSDWGISWGAMAVLGACALWGVDNNLTRKISAKDPLIIVSIKGLCAGSVSLALTFALGQSLPPFYTMLGALVLGSLGYGASIVLFIRAMRGLGAARTAALYSAAPFVGAILAFPLFQESIRVELLVSFPLMAVGAILLVSEEHYHPHLHEATQHEHRHCHDDVHHTHTHHELGCTASGFHTHLHTHERVRHDHCHAPDIHHRHLHQATD